MGSGVSTRRWQIPCVLPSVGQCKGFRAQDKEIMVREPEFVNTTKRMSRYPQSVHETAHISNSEFPYFKPKVVTVRPRPTEKGFSQHINVTRNDDIHNVHSNKFLMYNERYPIPKEKDFYESRNYKSYKYINDRRWSVSNVVPTKITTEPGNILLHKTVAELRESNQLQPYGRHYSYTCDMEPDYCAMSVNSGRRQPTPAPQTWYPCRRTSDYLVASSLLAAEQQHDRRNNF